MAECSRCGECCRTIPIGRIGSFKLEQREYLLTHGCRIEHGMMLIPIECPHLKDTGNLKSDFRDQEVARGKTYCDIYENRPPACRDFDGKPISHGRKYFVPDKCTMKVKHGQKP